MKLAEIKDTTEDELFHLKLASKKLEQLGFKPKMFEMDWLPGDSTTKPATQKYLWVGGDVFNVSIYYDESKTPRWETVWFKKSSGGGSSSTGHRFKFDSFTEVLHDLSPLVPQVKEEKDYSKVPMVWSMAARALRARKRVEVDAHLPGALYYLRGELSGVDEDRGQADIWAFRKNHVHKFTAEDDDSLTLKKIPAEGGEYYLRLINTGLDDAAE